ncbi:hypothetical protein DFJ63DRAFT_317331, partial [Scheffersomyces coipomensis]|uniref:uncharacterized protein n=1 Tax=Scheffersomyces coipomensis TaxID=1788519 RepID=UPI00315CDF38
MLASDNQFHGNIYSEYWYLYGACVAFLTIVLAISTSSFIKNFSTEMEAFRNECNVFVNIGSYPGLCSYLISIISIFFISYSLSDLLFGNPGLLFLLLIVVWLFTCYLLSNFIS